MRWRYVIVAFVLWQIVSLSIPRFEKAYEAKDNECNKCLRWAQEVSIRENGTGMLIDCDCILPIIKNIFWLLDSFILLAIGILLIINLFKARDKSGKIEKKVLIDSYKPLLFSLFVLLLLSDLGYVVFLL